MNFASVLVLATLASLFSTSSAQYDCSLCPYAGQLPARWDYALYVNGVVKSCKDLYLEMPALPTYDGTCDNFRGQAQAACCNAAEPATPSVAAAVSNTPAAYSGPVGNEGVCNICKDASYPGIPYGFIVARYVGEYTCEQLYGRGLHGMIPNYMCGPLQDFAQSVCGCGVYNPNANAAANNAHAQNSQASQHSQATYSLTAKGSSGTALYSGTPGTRNLRGGADADSKEHPSPESFHFETRELPADFFTSQTASKVSEPQAADSSESAQTETQAQEVQQ